jgi:predicted dehydrogenase
LTGSGQMMQPRTTCAATGQVRSGHGYHRGVVLRDCAHFLGCLQGGESPMTAASDNLKTMALCDAAYTAAATRSLIAPEY